MTRLPFAKPSFTKKKKIKRKKLPSMKGLKAKAWKVFSAWVKRRDMIGGIIICITCGSQVLPGDANSSHFIHGHSKPTFFDERNVHSSCVRCNLYLSGNLVEYAAFMQKKYGWETIDALRELSHQVVKPTREFYQEIIVRYKAKVKEIDERYRPQIGEADCVDSHREISEKAKVISPPAHNLNL